MSELYNKIAEKNRAPAAYPWAFFNLHKKEGWKNRLFVVY